MKVAMDKPTHQTRCEIKMGNQPCWTLPAGTKGWPRPGSRFLVAEPLPVEMTARAVGDTLYVEPHLLERIPG